MTDNEDGDGGDGGDGPSQRERSIDPRLLAILVCPVTKHRLELDATRSELVSHAASLAYPIRDGVPILTLDAARAIETDPAIKGHSV